MVVNQPKKSLEQQDARSSKQYCSFTRTCFRGDSTAAPFVLLRLNLRHGLLLVRSVDGKSVPGIAHTFLSNRVMAEVNVRSSRCNNNYYYFNDSSLSSIINKNNNNKIKK